MKTRFNEIMSILHQKITSEDICNKIMEMVQHSEHADKILHINSNIIKYNNNILKRLFSKDPTRFTQLYNCNCCRRHPRKKVLINYTDDYEILSLSIITKPCVFNPEHKFDTNLEDSCGCLCRSLTRNIMRRHLMRGGMSLERALRLDNFVVYPLGRGTARNEEDLTARNEVDLGIRRL